jgi:hypothetical protein
MAFSSTAQTRLLSVGEIPATGFIVNTKRIAVPDEPYELSPLRSDGRWDDWAAGVALYEKAVRPLTEGEMMALELDVEAVRPSPAPTPAAG